MKVFVCSPYRGDIERNTKRARAYVETVITQGHTPFAVSYTHLDVYKRQADRRTPMTALVWHYVVHIIAFLLAIIVTLGLISIPITLFIELVEFVRHEKRKTRKR